MTPNVLTIDIEDYFHVTHLRGVLPPDRWAGCPSHLEADTERILEILGWRNTRATFFVLGWVAEHFPQLVRRIHQAGHEVECHSHGHDLIYEQTPTQFRADLLRAKSILEDLTGSPVRGYRAPSFSLLPKCDWAYEILLEAGFQYSSSTVPIHHDNYPNPHGPTRPHLIGTADRCLVEVPISTLRVLGQNIPFSGGGYLRLLPYSWVARAIQHKNRAGEPVVVFLYSWEINPGQPRHAVSPLKRFRHYVNLSRTDWKLFQIIQDFPCQSMGAYVAGLLGQLAQSASPRPVTVGRPSCVE